MRFDDQLDIDSAMVIFAHPDDAEWMAGGTSAKWASEGVEITYVLVTNGSSGETPAYPDMTKDRLVAMRADEQQRAADVVGVKELVMLGLEDGYLEPNLDLRRAVAREIRRHKPDVVITHDPTQRTFADFYINHPDHIAVGEVVMRSMNPDASSRLMFPELERDEGLEKHLPKALFLGSFFEGGVYVDIDGWIDRKIEALLSHECQIEDPAGLSEWVRTQFKAVGEKAGTGYAEAFKVIRLGLV
jgi:LmbE family N-acetylglucosaminyl deacetylase